MDIHKNKIHIRKYDDFWKWLLLNVVGFGHLHGPTVHITVRTGQKWPPCSTLEEMRRDSLAHYLFIDWPTVMGMITWPFHVVVVCLYDWLLVALSFSMLSTTVLKFWEINRVKLSSRIMFLLSQTSGIFSQYLFVLGGGIIQYKVRNTSRVLTLQFLMFLPCR